MTLRQDVARGRDLVSRWCNLAEQRLEYLTELFETGRWRRFYSEVAFLENVREAKAAVETWRDLLTREASRDNYALDLSWLGRGKPMLPPDAKPRRHRSYAPPPYVATTEPPLSVAAASADVIRVSPRVSTPEAIVEPIFDLESFERTLPSIFQPPPEPAQDRAAEVTLDIASIQQRYPLLRNVL